MDEGGWRGSITGVEMADVLVVAALEQVGIWCTGDIERHDGRVGGGGAPDIVDRGVEVEREADAEGGGFQISGSPPKLRFTLSQRSQRRGPQKKFRKLSTHAALGPAANQNLDPKRPHLQVSTAPCPLSSALSRCPSRPISSNGGASCRGFVDQSFQILEYLLRPNANLRPCDGFLYHPLNLTLIYRYLVAKTNPIRAIINPRRFGISPLAAPSHDSLQQ